MSHVHLTNPVSSSFRAHRKMALPGLPAVSGSIWRLCTPRPTRALKCTPIIALTRKRPSAARPAGRLGSPAVPKPSAAGPAGRPAARRRAGWSTRFARSPEVKCPWASWSTGFALPPEDVPPGRLVDRPRAARPAGRPAEYAV